MKLDWDKEIMTQNLERLKYKEGELDANTLYMIGFYENYINANIVSEFIGFPGEKQNLEKKVSTGRMIRDIKENINGLKYVFKYELPKSINSMLTETLVSMAPLHAHHVTNNMEYNIPYNKTNEDYLIKQSYDMFTSVFPGFKKELDEIYDKKLVKVTTDKSIGSCDNKCFCDCYNGHGFVHINKAIRYDTLEATLNHELTHSITTRVNQELLTKLGILAEVHSIYMAYYTNNELYKQTHDNTYLKGNYNYLYSTKELTYSLGLYEKLATLKSITPKSIEDVFEKSLCYKVQDPKQLMQSISESDVLRELVYFTSNLAALHLLDQDPDKAKYLFIKSLYNDNKSLYNFFKTIEFDLKHPDYGTYLLEKYDVEMGKVRTRK